MQQFGVDISRWQGDFNLTAAKINNGVQFCIAKIGGGDSGLYEDRCFEENYSKAKFALLPVGCYFFGHAMSIAEAEREADYWIKIMKDRQFDYPVFYDVEGDMLKLRKRELTNIVKCVCERLENAGYWCGIYSSKSAFDTKMYDNELKKYSHWVAAWSSNKPVLKSGAAVQIWQFGGEVNKIRSNKINGVTVDQNYSYVDFPAAIKSKRLNNFGRETKGGAADRIDLIIDDLEKLKEDIKNDVPGL